MHPVLKSTLTLLCVALSLTACGQAVQPVRVQIPQPMLQVQAPLNLVLRFRPDTSRNQRTLLLSEYNLSLQKTLNAGEICVVVVPANAPLSLLATLKADPRLSQVDSAASQNGFTLAAQPSRLAGLNGRSLTLEGIYSNSHGASLMLAEGGEVLLVDAQGRVLPALDGIEDRTPVRVSGIVRNLPVGSALQPRAYQRI